MVLVTCAFGCSGATSASAPANGERRDASYERGAEDAMVDDAFEAAEGALDRVLVVRPAQFTEENMPMRMLDQNDPLELWPAPQGGHVVLVGAQVRKLPVDTAVLKVRVRHPDTNVIVAEEARTVKMVPVPGEADTMQPDLRSRSQVAHVPLCPDYDPFDIVDRPMSVTVQVLAPPVDPTHVGEATLTLVPTCIAADDEACRCECTANYVLGKCPGRPRDASVD
jgi:hypothetical protein